MLSRGTVDDVTGVSECIIMGMPMPTGTGLFQLRMEDDGSSGARKQSSMPQPLIA